MGGKSSKLFKKKKHVNSSDDKKLPDQEHVSLPSIDDKINEWELKNASYLAKVENIQLLTAKNIIKLFDDGNTIPFVARYRKDQVENLDPDKLRKIKDSYEYIKKVNAKANHLIKQIVGSQNFNPVLLNSIKSATSLEEIEFLGAPYKNENKGSLASRARALNLDEVANSILNGSHIVSLESYVKSKISGLEDVNRIREGIQHIIAEVISKTPKIQLILHKIIDSNTAILHSRKRKVEDKSETDFSKYESYKDFTQIIKYVKPYQIMAIFRGESEKKLSVKIEIPHEEWVQLKIYCQKKWINTGMNYELRHSLILDSVEDAIKRLMGPFVTRRIRSKLSKIAEEESISFFGSNLKQLLLMPPCKGKFIMGIDPGFQHGCKIAVISRQGLPLACTKVFLPQKNKKEDFNREKFCSKLKELIYKFECETIALGNGKGCRETEVYLADLIEKEEFKPLNVSYTIVSEQGVSIYSCSPEAAEEFPTTDPVYISAISLARRLQDPLSELVKVEPKHLGVGLYQHDVKSKLLSTALDEIVSECVSFVGVDLNTASYYLLKRVAGLNSAKAKEITKYRTENVAFRTLNDLKSVKGISEKTFVQCAGFLRILPSTSGWKINPLDQTSIHPESYKTAILIANKLDVDLNDLGSKKFISRVQSQLKKNVLGDMVKIGSSFGEINIIIEAFSKPVEHDIRNALSGPVFEKKIRRLEDLKVGQELTGIVKNVVPFGAFVDVGVGIDGLIHSSKMNNISLLLNDKVTVTIHSLELQRRRIGLKLQRKDS